MAISRIRPGLELPAVVYRCVEYLEAKVRLGGLARPILSLISTIKQNAECEEGIFRLSGSANVIRVSRLRSTLQEL